MHFLASINRAEVLSLDELLSKTFSDTKSSFDPKTDEILEKRALENLEKMRRTQVGG